MDKYDELGVKLLKGALNVNGGIFAGLINDMCGDSQNAKGGQGNGGGDFMDELGQLIFSPIFEEWEKQLSQFVP